MTNPLNITTHSLKRELIRRSFLNQPRMTCRILSGVTLTISTVPFTGVWIGTVVAEMRERLEPEENKNDQ